MIEIMQWQWKNKKERYISVLEQFCGELEEREDLDEKEERFRQDGTLPHTV